MVKKIINIPDLGEAEDVEVIEICAKEGDQVDSEDPIIVLESDKAAMEIPASMLIALTGCYWFIERVFLS